MKRCLAWAAVCCAAVLLGNRPAQAVLAFNTNVTPDVIFGSGNANGGWTVDTTDGVELGLRAKVRYDVPQNVFNYSGTQLVGSVPYGVYTFNAGAATAYPNRALWNFEFSVNTNADNLHAGRNLDDLTYLMRVDTMPQPVGAPLIFDPINVPYADHSIGTNLTLNGGGAEAADAAGYAALIGANNVAQNSANQGFFMSGFNPNSVGDYVISLGAFSGSSFVGQTGIVVRVVPEASAFLFGGVVCAASALVRWRRRAA